MPRRALVVLTLVVAATAGLTRSLAQDEAANRTADAASPVSGPSQPPPPGDVVQAPPPEDAVPPPESAPSEAPPAVDNETASQNAEASAPPAPPKRPRYSVAVLQALDKVTAETLRFEAKVNEPIRYKDLVITVHACETQALDEAGAESVAHLEIQDQPDVLPGRSPALARQVYLGWMYANAPALHPLEHPIYDVWVIACRTPSPVAAAGANL